ncbi:MAG: hypothetical protein JWQ09_5079 [Segetibacter sp.]|nr:hypothetical protein [Segetibacter sp.]
MQDALLKRITIDPEVCHGKPTIRGMRYPVDSILKYLAAGDSIEDILNEFTDLGREDILACFAYAFSSMKLKDIQVPSARNLS